MYYIHFKVNGKQVRMVRDLKRVLDKHNVGDIYKTGESHTTGYVEQYKILSKKIVAEVFGGNPLYEVECEDASYYDKTRIKPPSPFILYDPIAETYKQKVKNNEI